MGNKKIKRQDIGGYYTGKEKQSRSHEEVLKARVKDLRMSLTGKEQYAVILDVGAEVRMAGFSSLKDFLVWYCKATELSGEELRKQMLRTIVELKKQCPKRVAGIYYSETKIHVDDLKTPWAVFNA